MIAGIIGATGYAGAEVVRILAGHPEIEGLVLGSVSYEGGRIETMYLNFQGKISGLLEKPETVVAASGVVFAALPHGVGEPYAKACMEKGIPFIDLSADFRFDDDEETFTAWYAKPYLYPELRKRSVYGLPELNRDAVKALAAKGPVIIGNPGCYPTGASLGIYPALVKGLAGDGPVIVDAASGVTGGGREPGRAYHFPECSDSVSPYKVGAHRHTPEISRVLGKMAGKPVPLIFTPHLAPMNRGILSTIYIPLDRAHRLSAASGAPRPPSPELEGKLREIRDRYAAFYKDEPFVRVLPAGAAAATGRVRRSNFCDISLHLDTSGTTLIVVTAIDNMIKGAAGQAVQNMNILLGYSETAGLEAIPALF
ncbi:MAG: N-acetyl-gamma-glutamyl-phosphate reductase [Spirochaetaceae bacterium]|jgi:N-acetyl-gamma-glutamyl-phosphate reductase|nr:N-acetyl-gamma-glutamyl-phosphate reductase [Spirochaetaceae bacterium]